MYTPDSNSIHRIPGIHRTRLSAAKPARQCAICSKKDDIFQQLHLKKSLIGSKL